MARHTLANLLDRLGMWRFLSFVVLAVSVAVAAAIGFIVVDHTGPTGVGSPSKDVITNGIVAATAGLGLGLCFAWTRRIPWQRLPALMLLWRMRLARQMMWATLGCAALAVLVVY